MADEWTTAQLYRIAASLRLMGYRDAAAFVALAGRSVETDAKLKTPHRRLDIRSPAAAALDPAPSSAIVVPLASRRATFGRSS